MAACEYVPSLHLAVAFVGSVFAAVAFATFDDCFTSEVVVRLAVFSALTSCLVSCFALFSAFVSFFATALVSVFAAALLSAFAAFVLRFADFAAALSTPP